MTFAFVLCATILSICGVSRLYAQECKPSHILTRLSLGVDITTLDILPFKKPSSKNDSSEQPSTPLLEFTCNHTGAWADQIDNITIPAKFEFPTQDIVISLYGFMDILRYPLEMTARFPIAPLVLNEQYRVAQKEILQDGKSILRLGVRIPTRQIYLKDPDLLIPSTQFSEALSKLPPNYVDSPSLYDQLVDTFGTHYFQATYYGTYWSPECVIDDSYFFTTGIKKISDSTWNMSQVSPSVPVESLNIDQAFLDHSTCAHKEFGSKRATLIGGIVNGTIAELVDDPTISDSLGLAIHVKMTKAVLQSWQYSLELISQSHEGWILQGVFSLEPIISDIKQRLTRVIPMDGEAEVIELNNQVKAIVEYVQLMKCGWANVGKPICYFKNY